MIILDGILGDLLWGAVVPLVYCGCISLAPECSLVCCSGLDCEEGIDIIHLLGPDSFQCDILFFITMTLWLSKVTIHSLSHDCPIEIRLQWRLGKISVCFPLLDNVLNGIWAWCVDAIVMSWEVIH